MTDAVWDSYSAAHQPCDFILSHIVMNGVPMICRTPAVLSVFIIGAITQNQQDNIVILLCFCVFDILEIV